MDRSDTDPRLSPIAVRMAEPLIERFCSSRFCPPSHQWHARSTLPVLALFVGMAAPPTDVLHWEELDADDLLLVTLEIEPEERGFLRDLLDVSASFYAYLGEERIVPRARARQLRLRFAELALGLA
jgi:hypothetical protein